MMKNEKCSNNFSASNKEVIRDIVIRVSNLCCRMLIKVMDYVLKFSKDDMNRTWVGTRWTGLKIIRTE